MSKLAKREKKLLAQNAGEEKNESENNNETPPNWINFTIAESIVDFLIESIPVNIENEMETEDEKAIPKLYSANSIIEFIPLEIKDKLHNRKGIQGNVKKGKKNKSVALVKSIINSLIECIPDDVTNHKTCKKCGYKYGYLFKTEKEMCKGCFKKKSKKERFRLRTRENATCETLRSFLKRKGFKLKNGPIPYELLLAKSYGLNKRNVKPDNSKKDSVILDKNIQELLKEKIQDIEKEIDLEMKLRNQNERAKKKRKVKKSTEKDKTSNLQPLITHWNHFKLNIERLSLMTILTVQTIVIFYIIPFAAANGKENGILTPETVVKGVICLCFLFLFCLLFYLFYFMAYLFCFKKKEGKLMKMT